VKNLIRIDNKFESPQCSGKCSDVFGAIVNASRVAEDLVSAGDSSETPSLCVAISSDMYNMSPTTETSGPLNSREIVRTAKSVEEAEERGIEAAKLINIKFPIAVKTRVFVLSSSGPGSLPLERNIYFDAYWNAFWSEVGIESTEQIKSLDQACIQSGRTSR
ncbi:MAG: hypothetical protein RLZZ251_500, partial [Actinomycetota bacterium]